MRIAVIVLLVASTVYAGGRRLLETARLARELARIDELDERRSILFGTWYRAVRDVARGVPSDASVDFVMLRPEARDIAVLGAAELQPRDVRLFDGWAAWRERRRAILIHGPHAANAVGPPPPPARFVVVVDPHAEPPLKFAEPPR